MFFDIFQVNRTHARELVRANSVRLRGTCYAGDGTPMRFRLYGEVAYVLPSKAMRQGKEKGLWIHRRGLYLLNPVLSNS